MPGFGRNSLACVGCSVNCLKSKKQLKMPRFYGLQNKLGFFSAIETSTRTLHINKEFKKRRRLRLRQRQKPVILLVKRTKMIVLHVRHAFLNKSLPYSSKLQREMTKFQVLTTTWTNYSESFSLTLYFKSVRTNPVIGHFAHIA